MCFLAREFSENVWCTGELLLVVFDDGGATSIESSTGEVGIDFEGNVENDERFGDLAEYEEIGLLLLILFGVVVGRVGDEHRVW